MLETNPENEGDAEPRANMVIMIRVDYLKSFIFAMRQTKNSLKEVWQLQGWVLDSFYPCRNCRSPP